MPCAAAPSTIRRSSVATTTRSAPLASARSATRTTIGFPAMSASGLPGKRVDAQRAGMRTVNTRSLRHSFLQLFAFLRRELARLLLQHDGDAVANRIGETRGSRNQLLLGAVVDQRPFGDGANEHFEQLVIHGVFRGPVRQAPDRFARAPASTR